MRFLKIFFLCLISPFSLAAQTGADDFKFVGRFDFENPNERILAYKPLEDGKLQLVGSNTFQIWDTANNKVLESKHHDIENLTAASFGGANPRQDKILVLGGLDFEKKTFPTSVWDVKAAKRIAVLDKGARAVVSGVWSKNGKTFITASNTAFASGVMDHERETELCFYDGETLAFRGAIQIEDLTWLYLSDDGERLYTTSVPRKKGLFGIAFVNGMANVIKIWNTQTAQAEGNFSVGGDDFATLTWKLSPSSDGKYFALVSKNRNGDDDSHRVLIWEISGKAALPKYSIKANPKISSSTISYSPSGKYFALDAGRTAQIYELETGELKFELVNSIVPQFWLDDERVALYNYSGKIRAFKMETGKLLYEEKAVYETTDVPTGISTTDENGNYKQETTSEVTDYTRVAAHPNGRFFVAYSNKTAKVYDARTGANLMTLISPPPTFEKKRKFLGIPLPKARGGENLVKEAGWFADGKTIFVHDWRGTSISLWTMKN